MEKKKLEPYYNLFLILNPRHEFTFVEYLNNFYRVDRTWEQWKEGLLMTITTDYLTATRLFKEEAAGYILVGSEKLENLSNPIIHTCYVLSEWPVLDKNYKLCSDILMNLA